MSLLAIASRLTRFCIRSKLKPRYFCKEVIKNPFKMQEKYVMLNGVPTHLMYWGNNDFEEKPDTDEIIVCVTGNPGLPGFYTTFLGTVYKELDEKVPIWVIGHAGHDDPPDNHPLLKQVPPLKGNGDLYNLQGQIKHKTEFLSKYIPENAKINFIGHSVGSWVILELLKNPDIEKRVHYCYLLFPTIERMLESKNGFILYKILDPIFFVFRVFYHIFNLLPFTIKVLLMQVYFWANSMPKVFMGSAIKYTKPCVIDKIWHLALDEMEKIKEIDTENIRKNMHRLKFYYGTKDAWVPTDYYHQLIEKFPGIDAELCTKEMDHAFVLRSGPEMARMLTGWILRNKLK